MATFGQHVTSRDLELRSNIDLTNTIRSQYVYVSMRLDEGNTLAFLVQKLSAKTVLPKTAILPFYGPWRLNLARARRFS